MSQALLTLVQLYHAAAHVCTVVRFGGELTVRIRRRRVVETTGVEVRRAG